MGFPVSMFSLMWGRSVRVTKLPLPWQATPQRRRAKLPAEGATHLGFTQRWEQQTPPRGPLRPPAPHHAGDSHGNCDGSVPGTVPNHRLMFNPQSPPPQRHCQWPHCTHGQHRRGRPPAPGCAEDRLPARELTGQLPAPLGNCESSAICSTLFFLSPSSLLLETSLLPSTLPRSGAFWGRGCPNLTGNIFTPCTFPASSPALCERTKPGYCPLPS